MASIRKEIVTCASAGQVWSALRDVGALHTRLVPGFVIGTQLEPGARLVTFANGMVVRERIIDIDDEHKRIVWSATGGQLSHHNGSAQIVAEPDGRTKVVWIADILPDEMKTSIARMMDDGMAAMKAALDRLG
jgi:hypothetical protein